MTNRREFLHRAMAAGVAALLRPAAAAAQTRAGFAETVLGPVDAGKLGFIG